MVSGVLQGLNGVTLSGWGRAPVVTADGDFPDTMREALGDFHSHSLPRGLGRSYGDASLPAPGHRFLDTRRLDRILSFDAATGILVAEAGISLRDILQVLVPRGWFLPVTPGTRWVTLGGAVASNVHGKNHHQSGSIEHFVTELEIVTPTGVHRCTPTENPDLFRATVGGYGLTGLILRVGIRMKPLSSPLLRSRSLRAKQLAGLFDLFREHDAGSEYSVAWVDTLARGDSLGRGVLMLGDHAGPGTVPDREPPAADSDRTLFRVAFSPPAGLLQPWAMRIFNGAYYHLPRSGKEHPSLYGDFFYPLDRVENWNRLYGPKGFFQYQFVIPDPDGTGAGEAGVRAALDFLTRHGMGSFLAVLKRCGEDAVLLPFCRRGFTLALDIPHRGAETLRGLEDLDRIVIEHGGRVYLTKDARLPRETFRAMYPEWVEWMRVVKRYNPEGKGISRMAERLGLWS